MCGGVEIALRRGIDCSPGEPGELFELNLEG